MKYLLFSSLTFILLFGACKKDPDQSDGNLIGTWNVVQVKGIQITNGVPGIEIADDEPTGFIRFDDNGRGEQNYSYKLFGTTYPNTGAFVWTATETEIKIKQIAKPDLIWIRKINTINQQQATFDISISPTSKIEYTLTLEK
jgi:hypothetical protein